MKSYKMITNDQWMCPNVYEFISKLQLDMSKAPPLELLTQRVNKEKMQNDFEKI